MIDRFTSEERYASASPPRPSPGQLSPTSSQGSPVSPLSPRGSPLSPHGSPLSTHLSFLSPQLCPAVCPQLSPTRELPQLSEQQLAVLEASFLVNRNPCRSDIMLLGVELQVDEPQVKVRSSRLVVWFNRDVS